jgi:hypothetical protein
MGREPTTEEVEQVSERELTARPTLTDRDREGAEARVGVDDADHLAAGKHDAIDQGTSGGEAEAERLRTEEVRARQRRT